MINAIHLAFESDSNRRYGKAVRDAVAVAAALGH